MSFDLELINNDIKLQPDGKMRVVTDTPKLRQDIIKIILTPLGSVKSHPWYGCTVSDDLIGRNLPDHMLGSEIKASVTQSLERLKALQVGQATTQKVSLAEMINVIYEVDAERDVNDRRLVNIIVTVLSKRLTKIEELFTLIS